jgi:SAM-dependent methyltransferase
MATYAISPEAQLRQTEFRIRLVDGWDIAPGSRVLEIGCGQGDTTAVLAEAVGPSGSVLAVDLAQPSYGAPVSIGDSADHLLSGPLGDRIQFCFGVDVLRENFPEDSFDVVVLAHCTWYFASLTILESVLARACSWGPKLCLSEWDLQPRSIHELGHFMAISIQGLIEAFDEQTGSNVRTPYSRELLQRLLDESAWEVVSETLVETAGLDDALWEIDACLKTSLNPELPPKHRALVSSQRDVLRRLSKSQNLPSYSIVARRA